MPGSRPWRRLWGPGQSLRAAAPPMYGRPCYWPCGGTGGQGYRAETMWQSYPRAQPRASVLGGGSGGLRLARSWSPSECDWASWAVVWGTPRGSQSQQISRAQVMGPQELDLSVSWGAHSEQRGWVTSVPCQCSKLGNGGLRSPYNA